jgi:DNA-binding response OmpR family regulator
MRLLIIEDEGDLGELLKSNLARRGFAVDWYGTRADAEAALAIGTYDLILLDRRLPDGDGLDLLRHLRAAGSATPVIVITAQDAVVDRVEGLNSGGDDYLVKPFATDELVARINAVLRRPAQAHNQVLRVGNIALDTGTREVRVAEKPALLPRRELTLLELLLRRAGRVVTRNSIADGLYAHGEEAESNAVESHVSRLRKRLATLGGDVAIRTVRGIGYILEERSGAAAEPLD